MRNPRVWIAGLDGATFALIQPWVAEGHLPVLQRLMGEGVVGELRSTFPPLTGPAWGSFMTGKTPGRHGVLEFFRREQGTYRQVLNSARDLDGKTVWKRLSEAGKYVGVIGVPLTYPPEAVNGFMITGLLTPAGARDFTYPPDLLDEIEAHVGQCRVRHDEKYRQGNPEPFIREQYEILENNTEVALYLMRNKPWDMFMVHFYGTDRMQHELWHVMEPLHPQHSRLERQRYGNVILDFFRQVDASLGRLIEELDKEGDVVTLVMSDHGFGPVCKFINMNTWLLQQGLLRLKRTPATWLRHQLFRLGLSYSTAAKWVLRLGFGRQTVRMGRARREELQRQLFLSLDDVDWSRTQVYSIGNFGQLYVNLQGREPQGCVAPGDAQERVLEDLSQRLMAMADPETGQTVVEMILRREDVYDGPYADQAPDLLFFTRDMEYKAMGLSDFSSHRVFNPVYGCTGHHRMDGIMIWRGPGVIREGEWVEGARICDLAPTILYIFGQPVPPEMDGQVLSDIFTPEFRTQHPLVRFESDRTATKGVRAGSQRRSSKPSAGGDGQEEEEAYSEEEEAQVAEMLRALGYVT